MNKNAIYILLLLIFHSCKIEFAPKNIPYDVVKTYSVEQFETRAALAPPTAGQTFSELLKNKIQNDTRLQLVINEDGDLSYSGYLAKYQITSLAPTANETSAIQRLTITINIDLVNNKQKDKDWSASFSRFADFGADTDLGDVQNQLIEEIYEQILEDVFNKSFGDW